MKKIIDIIGYDSGWGCRDFGCEDGPHMLALDQIIHALAAGGGASPRWLGNLGLKFLGRRKDMTEKLETLPYLLTGLQRLHDRVRGSVRDGHFPLVIGGDHSSAIGTWSGVVSALKCPEHFGLIWLDAHLDSHTLETSSEGKFGGWWHGQPVTALTGYGLGSLAAIGGHLPKISPQHMTFVGVHSFEPSEASFVRRHGIRVITLDEIRKTGFQSAMDEALHRATHGTKGFGLSIDLDAFHPDEAPGVGACEKDGLFSRDVLPILNGIGHHPALKALEVVEYNPHLDRARKTERLLQRLLAEIFHGV